MTLPSMGSTSYRRPYGSIIKRKPSTYGPTPRVRVSSAVETASVSDTQSQRKPTNAVEHVPFFITLGKKRFLV